MQKLTLFTRLYKDAGQLNIKFLMFAKQCLAMPPERVAAFRGVNKYCCVTLFTF